VTYPTNVRRPRKAVTKSIVEAFRGIDELAPFNSAHERKITSTVKYLYQEYQKLPHDSNWKPLNERYFRELVNGMHVKMNCDPQQCLYHQVWHHTKKGTEGMGEDLFLKCCSHFRITTLQRQAYFNFKEELIEGHFGKKMLGWEDTVGHLIVIGMLFLRILYVRILIVRFCSVRS
jgi:hypothetical protein